MPITVCPQCRETNTTLMWWEQEDPHRWVCYPCGMGRREEQTRIEQRWKRENATTPTAQAPIS